VGLIHQILIDFKNEILTRAAGFSADADFDELLTGLISELDGLSESRQDYGIVLARMFRRINEGRTEGLDTRPSSEAFDTMAPIAMGIADLASFVEIMRAQVHVLTATGDNLDQLGADYAFFRFEATRALRRGVTYNNRMEQADFPLGSRFLGPDTELSFVIEDSEGGQALFRSEQYGSVGNQFFGDLIGVNVNGLGRALLTDELGAYMPAQDRETDAAYRRRFLRFLQRKAFGGNVAQYMQELQNIDGVGNVMVFPCWRGAWTVGVSIVDGQNQPVSDDFVEAVAKLVDPVARGGTGLGFAPVGHRVTVATPKYYDIDLHLPIFAAEGASHGQLYGALREIAEVYMRERVQAVFDIWERTYFANEGIANPYVDLSEAIEGLRNDPRYADMLNILGHFDPKRVVQAHNFEVLVQPQVLGVRVLQHELVSAVDFENIRVNGERWLGGYAVKSNQDGQFLPRLRGLEIELMT